MGKKFKLDISYEWEGKVFAISSAWPDYRMAWLISKTLRISLARSEDLILEEINNKKNTFLLYQYKNEYTTFRLLKNKAHESQGKQSPYLLPELKHFDFILLVETEADIDFNQMHESLKNIDSIQLIQLFDPNNLKSKQNIAF